MMIHVRRGIVLSTIFLAGAVAAADKMPPSPLLGAVIDCKAESNDAKRLQCYDQAVGALGRASSAGQVIVFTREDIRKTRRSLFGFTLPKLPFFGGDDDEEDDTPKQLDANIVSVRSLGYGKFLLTLDSGGTWRTTEPDTRPPDPRAGDKIRIKRGAIGSYFLSISGHRSVKGIRVN